VAARKAEGFNVIAACDAAGVSRSAFYAWQTRPAGPTDRQWDDAHLLNDIRDLHKASGGVDGEPRITAALRERGWVINHKRTARLMREQHIVGWRPRRRRSLTKQDADAVPLPDLVKRRFNPTELDHTWVGDITYIPTGQGWFYLATVIDLASRRLLGWSMGDRHDATLVIDALHAAVGARGRSSMDGTIFHSDRGSEYTARLFRQACIDAGIRQSVGRTGSCLDNAVAESLFATFKIEAVHRTRFDTRAQARTTTFRWIVRYNHRRLHSTLGMIAPITWENRHLQSQHQPRQHAA
jgi:transposase InsO family protein